MKNHGFGRPEDISRIGIHITTNGAPDLVQDLTHLAEEEVKPDDAVSDISTDIAKKTNGVIQDQRIEDLEMRRELLKHILNGTIFEFYDVYNTIDLEKQIKVALEDLRREKRAEFIAKFDTRVPMADFDAYFKQKRDRIVSLYRYQKCAAESSSVFAYYKTPKWDDMLKREYFKTNFLNNYLHATSMKGFNTEGFNELVETNGFFEELFSKGSFDEFGASLLKEALEEYKTLLSGLNRRFSEISDDFFGVLMAVIQLLESLEQKNWRFDKTDILRLRNAYKYDKHPGDSAYPEISRKLKEAVGKYRNPATISSGLLSSNDIAQIAIALNIVRNSVGNGGLIRNVDLDKLREISIYLDDVCKFKSGLLTIQENETLRQMVCNLKVLIQKSNLFGLEHGKSERDIILNESKLLGPGVYEKLLAAFKQYLKPIAENSISPTMIFDPLVLKLKIEEETRKNVEIDEQIHKEDVFFKKVKYVRESPAFDFLFAQRTNFENALSKFDFSIENNNMDIAMEALAKLELPAPIKMQDYFDNDLDRFIILEMAHFYEELRKQGVSFSKNISEHLEEFERQKESLKPKLLRLSLLAHSIAHIYGSPEGVHNQTQRINSNYVEIKRYVRDNAETKDPSRFVHEAFLINMDSLYLQSQVFEIGEKIYNYEMYSLDPKIKASESFSSDAKKFIDTLMILANPKNFKPDYVMDKESLFRLKKVVKFALDLKMIFPSLDDSITSRRMVEIALNKFEGR